MRKINLKEGVQIINEAVRKESWFNMIKEGSFYS